MAQVNSGQAGNSSAGRAHILLWFGAVLGIGLATFAIVESREAAKQALGHETIAKVNHTFISREVYDTQIDRLASDKRSPMTDADKVHVLERMIEEELLIQRGVEIGLVERNRPVRAALVQAMIDAIIADSRSMDVSESALETFYQENSSYFIRSAHLQVGMVRFNPRQGETLEQRLERANQARLALGNGQSVAQVERALGDPAVLRVPAALLPAAKLREYIGPSLLKLALEMKVGEVSEPVSIAGGHAILILQNVQADTPPPLAEIRDTVEAEYRKRAGDEALREYLDWLKTRADVVRVRELPEEDAQ